MMNEERVLGWRLFPNGFARFVVAARRIARVLRARYWFPQIPLALALAWAGFLPLRHVFNRQSNVLLADFPRHILDFRPASMPYVLIGVAMVVMSVGLLFRRASPGSLPSS